MRTLLRIVVLALALMVFCSAPATHAEKRHTIYMICWRGVTEGERGFMEYFTDRKLPVEFIMRDCDKDKNRLPGFVEEIKRIRPSLIYVFGTTGALGVFGSRDHHPETKFVTDIPGVFNIVSVPVESGLVANLDTSERNLTGTVHIAPLEIQLKTMRSIRKWRRIGVVYNPQEKNSSLALQKLQSMGRDQGFEVVTSAFRLKADKNPDEASIPDAVEALVAQKPELVYFPSDSFLVANAAAVVKMLNPHGIPVFSATEEPITKSGALMGLVCHYYNVGQYSAYKAEQILFKGKHPSQIPMDSLNRFSLVFNITAARTLDFFPPFHLIKLVEIVK